MKHLMALLVCLCAASTWAEPSLSPKSCVQTRQDICVDATPCKSVSGVTTCLAGVALATGAVNVNASCWKYEATFSCEDTASVDSCQPMRDRSCGQIGSTCLSTDPDGKCVSVGMSFSCPDKPLTTTQQTVCDTAFCQSGSGCFETTSKADKDFGIAAAMVEVSREAGVYGIEGGRIEIFKGFREECSVKGLGGLELNSCCNPSGGGAGYKNSALMSTALSAGGGVAGSLGGSVVKAGSAYVYDALYQQSGSALMDKALGAMNSAASNLGSSTTNFGAYGFDFSFSVANGFEFVGFDPTSFAISIAIQLITQWLSCTPEEKVHAMKKGQNLCVFVESYCASKIPIINVCIEVKQVSCCFNSILAKSVNRQGRAQLGMAMNQCGGFDQAQLKALDFSRIDLSEFIATLQITPPNMSSLNNQVSATVRQKINSYYRP